MGEGRVGAVSPCVSSQSAVNQSGGRHPPGPQPACANLIKVFFTPVLNFYNCYT